MHANLAARNSETIDVIVCDDGCRFAFVEFETEAAAAAAIEQHNNEEVDGREIHVSAAGSGGSKQSNSSYSLISQAFGFDQFLTKVC